MRGPRTMTTQSPARPKPLAKITILQSCPAAKPSLWVV